MSNLNNVSLASAASCFTPSRDGDETPFGNYFTPSARDGLVWWGCDDSAWRSCYHGYAAKMIDWGFPLPEKYFEEKGLDTCAPLSWDVTHRSY
jgi:hypothetical protein